MASKRSKKPLWTCPKCGHTFVTANIWHSCTTVDLESHFHGKSPLLLETFERFVQLARVRFAGAVARKDWLDAGVSLKRRAEHPRLHRIELFGSAGFGHHFRLSRPEDVDDGLASLVREAYQIGIQA
jgi:hypothetical protein